MGSTDFPECCLFESLRFADYHLVRASGTCKAKLLHYLFVGPLPLGIQTGEISFEVGSIRVSAVVEICDIFIFALCLEQPRSAFGS